MKNMKQDIKYRYSQEMKTVIANDPFTRAYYTANINKELQMDCINMIQLHPRFDNVFIYQKAPKMLPQVVSHKPYKMTTYDL